MGESQHFFSVGGETKVGESWGRDESRRKTKLENRMEQTQARETWGGRGHKKNFEKRGEWIDVTGGIKLSDVKDDRVREQRNLN